MSRARANPLDPRCVGADRRVASTRNDARSNIDREAQRDLETWTVTDDWPEEVPVTRAEVDVIEAWLGDLFDQRFGPRR
ncbi:hypothetical protein FM996_12780 [Methylosinus sporium]|uniref:Uncharacterized protein n=1 Tax=Methylosinus sporium TaxID=428 RepID=A0A549SRL8_METSR|nr:hypothetical protein FM996_12780 [Methylosinus sporium]